MAPTNPVFLTTDEVAERYKLDKRTVRKYVHVGWLKVHDFGSGNRRIWRFAEADLRAFEAQRAASTAA